MFEEPVVVLEGQPLSLVFQTNLDIANGGGTRFTPDQQGQGSKAPDLYLEVGNTGFPGSRMTRGSTPGPTTG